MKRTRIALITILLTALCLCTITTTAFAAGEPSLSASTDSAKPGETISFTITPNNVVLDADVKVEGPLTFVSVTGAAAYAEDSFNTKNTNVTYTYIVNEDAVPGASYSFAIYNVLVFDEEVGDANGESLGNMSVSGVISGTEPVYETITLPAGTVYYTMIEGAPGTSNTLEKVATVSVIEKMNNGYTKILMGTTTYLISSTNPSPGSSNSKLDKAPKTADATPTIWVLSLAAIAAASALSVYAAKKITAK